MGCASGGNRKRTAQRSNSVKQSEKAMKLPSQVFTHLGPVPVSLDGEMAQKEKDDDFSTYGLFCKQKRTVKVDAQSAPESQLSTLLHECVHIALWDAGTANILTDVQTEAVCDALGTYLAAAVIAGYLKLHVPR